VLPEREAGIIGWCPRKTRKGTKAEKREGYGSLECEAEARNEISQQKKKPGKENHETGEIDESGSIAFRFLGFVASSS
jgi:hypothetical protein